MTHIFISYSKKNKPYTDRLVHYLEQAGFNVWYDGRIDYGNNWEKEIVKAIESCAAFLVIMTPDAEESDWVSIECQHARDVGKPPFPLLLEGNVFFRYKLTQYVDVRGEILPPEDFLKRLEQYLQRQNQQGQNIAPPEVDAIKAPQPVKNPYTLYTDGMTPEKQQLIDALNHPATEPIKRGEIGRRLAELGDPRPGVGLDKDGLLDIVWCKVPAGAFLFGSNRRKDKQARDSEPAQKKVDLPTFYMAQYPVTVAQYAAFVQDGGYQNSAYWTKAGLTWKGSKNHPEYGWQDAKWHIANHPVTGVTWYESVAFCRWLSQQRGMDIRLPTEAEFEKAARGKTEWIYPYGDTLDTNKGNTGESGIGRTSAVGMFPSGVSPYGVMDMSGNVWEWSLSPWANPYQSHTAEQVDWEGNAIRALRGGSWGSNVGYARVSVRYTYNPYYRRYDSGFRVCRL